MGFFRYLSAGMWLEWTLEIIKIDFLSSSKVSKNKIKITKIKIYKKRISEACCLILEVFELVEVSLDLSKQLCDACLVVVEINDSV